MKKVLQFILILIVILVVGFLVLCAVTDGTVNIERSATINAPKNVVWNQVVKFKNWRYWNPWQKMDTTMVIDIEGVDGEEGSVYHWVGETSGEGYMTNTKVDGYRMNYDMHFIKPFEGKPDGYFTVTDEGGKTKVTWGYHDEQSFFMRGFSAILGMKKMLTASFDEGLGYLKEHIESGAAYTYDIKQATFPATTYATLRETVAFQDMHQFFSQAYPKIYTAAGDRIDASRPSAAIYYSWDMENMKSDLAAAFAVKGTDEIKGLEIVDIPQSSAYMIKYVGGYGNMEAAHMELNRYLESNNIKDVMVVEEYEVMAQTQADSNKWVTNIYYITK